MLIALTLRAPGLPNAVLLGQWPSTCDAVQAGIDMASRHHEAVPCSVSARRVA